MTITVKNVSRSFGSFKALDKVSLTIPSGQLVALLGPSGSGKTTLLRIIAGIEQPDQNGEGTVFFKDLDMASTHPRDRGVGFVFQHYALFKHMTVFENIAFGLRIKPKKLRPSKESIQNRVNELLQLVQLDGMGHRYPDQLSGGQRQRVALARALAVEPQVLLLDEPFGALDARVRKELRSWLRRLHDELHMTSVFVTHDQEEALEVADIVVIMNHGRIEQIGSPHEVFHHPANEFVMRFLGEVNAFTGRMTGDSIELLGSIEIPFQGDSPTTSGTREDAPVSEASIFVRPHDLTIDLSPSDQPSITATVLQIHSAGPVVRVQLKTASGEAFSAELSQTRFQSMKLECGSRVFVRPRHIKVFAANA